MHYYSLTCLVHDSLYTSMQPVHILRVYMHANLQTMMMPFNWYMYAHSECIRMHACIHALIMYNAYSLSVLCMPRAWCLVHLLLSCISRLVQSPLSFMSCTWYASLHASRHTYTNDQCMYPHSACTSMPSVHILRVSMHANPHTVRTLGVCMHARLHTCTNHVRCIHALCTLHASRMMPCTSAALWHKPACTVPSLFHVLYMIRQHASRCKVHTHCVQIWRMHSHRLVHVNAAVAPCHIEYTLCKKATLPQTSLWRSHRLDRSRHRFSTVVAWCIIVRPTPDTFALGLDGGAPPTTEAWMSVTISTQKNSFVYCWVSTGG
jgi:hypothetical protein